MDNDRHLTFRQRYGYEDLPSPMKAGELSDDFRRELWNLLWRFICDNTHHSYYGGSSYNAQFSGFLIRILGKYAKQTEDTISTEYDQTNSRLKRVVLDGNPKHLLPLVEFMAGDHFTPEGLLKKLSTLFDEHRAAYRIDITERPYRIFKRTSVEESDATLHSIERLKDHGFEPALAHLRHAAEHMHIGQFADSIADSVHAVESVARSIAPGENTLGKTLNKLKTEGKIEHSSLIQGFLKIYGYTSDEGGVRHALINSDTANVDETLALFFYNACAAFAGYLATLGGER